MTIAPCRDDAARLGLLRTDDADLALVSSAALALARAGARVVLDVGVALERPLPSTGLAVGAGLRAERPEVVERLTSVHRDALRLLHADTRSAGATLEAVFGLPATLLQALRERMTADGTVPKLDQVSLGTW